MKKVIYIFFFLLCPLILFGQERTQDMKKEQSEGGLKGRQENSAASDSSNNGNPENCKQKMRKRMMDSFMDKDGDGINDCRQRGMRWSGKGTAAGQESGKGKHRGFGRHGK